MRTFFEDSRDWDGTNLTADAFNPSTLDCEQWVRTAAEAGARYMVLVAKHHDGFSNWPSRYTDYSVASSPWKNGRGDVVREFTDACKKYGMKVGLYYSPADASCPVYDDPGKYDDYFINQISEILTPYGLVDLLWFDGCGSENHQYDWARIIGEVRRMQPGILIFNMGEPDYRWSGNESGIAPYPCRNVIDTLDFSIQTERRESLGAQAWLPVECDCRMREKSWFYRESDVHTVKSPEELMGIYYLSVGRGANLLLNIAPDRRGLLPEADTASLLAFGREVKRRFANPVAGTENFNRENNTWSCVLKSPAIIDHAILQENLQNGESGADFAIKIAPYPRGKLVTVYEGSFIGHKAICQFPAVRTNSIVIELSNIKRPVTLSSIQLFSCENAFRTIETEILQTV